MFGGKRKNVSHSFPNQSSLLCCYGCWGMRAETPVSTRRNPEVCSWPLTPAAGWWRASRFPAAFPISALRGPPLGPQPGTSFSHLPPGKIPAALPAPRHLSPPFPLLSVFQKRVEIPHLLTPSSASLIVGLYLFLFPRHHITGGWEEGEIVRVL